VATEIGSPHRARGPRTPATPGAARDAEDAPHRARLEQENAELRIQLALANQLAASDKRYAELQMSTDATIRELLLSRDESRAQASRLEELLLDSFRLAGMNSVMLLHYALLEQMRGAGLGQRSADWQGDPGNCT
jgi:hypothetical protein